ncbi:MAG TPA: hypothetical protein VEX70_07310 [Pyrinomonadaceae bacterium]|nr:hypothetical protein [Pyrinomonadaceae bacterium]
MSSAAFNNSRSRVRDIDRRGDGARALETNDLIANMVEYPAVARGRGRFRFQVMATHTPEQIDTAAGIFRRSLALARACMSE